MARSARFGAALAAIDRAFALAAPDPAERVLRVHCLTKLGRLLDAEQELRLAEPANPVNHRWFLAATSLHRARGHFDLACDVAAEGVRRFPDNPVAALNLAEALSGARRYQEAADFIEPLLGRETCSAALVQLWGTMCRRLNRPERALAMLERWSARTDLAAEQRRDVLFELAMVFDALGRFDEAFSVFVRANAAVRASFDLPGYRDAVERLRGAWTAQAMREHMPSTGLADCSDVILVVGMPRSGSTLVEQIIQAHSAVAAAGEVEWLPDASLTLDPPGMRHWGVVRTTRGLSPSTIAAVNAAYRTQLDAFGRSARTVDKNLGNHRLLGLARLALPGARVLWCRRHPLDTVLSCFFQNFRSNAGYDRLDVIVHRLHLADQLAEHWGEVLDRPFLPVHYEDLVAEPESKIRELVGAVGLDWEAGCLRPDQSGRVAQTASRHQVDQPIYQGSVGRWRNYEKHLAHPISILQRLGYEL